MFQVQFLCPRQGPNWQTYEEGFLFFRRPATFPTFAAAQMVCDSLIWQYHSARVIDPSGNIVYQR